MFPGSCDFMARGDRADRALGGEEIDGSVMRMRGEFVEGIVELCWMGSTLLWLSASDVFIHSFSVSSSRADHKNVAAVSRRPWHIADALLVGNAHHRCHAIRPSGQSSAP